MVSRKDVDMVMITLSENDEDIVLELETSDGKLNRFTSEDVYWMSTTYLNKFVAHGKVLKPFRNMDGKTWKKTK